ncbi:hypothetical protein Mar181_0350 [Marinomonas posidonica IVIA-Po-181]|uniref:Uncharacterized protein n=1 Tax=Marinomonas posidonica (strain CECT 7376 / NCIMB 14433 / IVIA-Po-181) TaxID=491952 RepID=F6CY88_MARPP|nr:hypothetical protein Mar181_0350 [Marinomonas posidonica IVIA-Po-181]
MRSNLLDLVQCQLIRMSSDIKALKTLSIVIPDTIDHETTVTSEGISSLLKCVVESMKNSQESLFVALQETA